MDIETITIDVVENGFVIIINRSEDYERLIANNIEELVTKIRNELEQEE